VLAATVVGLIVGSTVFKCTWSSSPAVLRDGAARRHRRRARPNRIAKSFIAGAKDIASAALIVGFAGGIVVILEDGHILDTILYGMPR